MEEEEKKEAVPDISPSSLETLKFMFVILGEEADSLR